MIILTLLCVVLIDSYKKVKDEERIEEQNRKKEELEQMLKEDQEATDTDAVQENYVTFIALGQNYMDDNVIQSGVTAEGTSNYDFLFSEVSSYLQEADLTAVTQGMVVAGNSLGVSGSKPAFNSPEELCDAYVAAGVDAVAMGTTRIHSMGSAGIQSCIDLFKSKAPDMKVLGIHSKAEEPATEENPTAGINIAEVNGIKIAMLSYTAVLTDSYISNEDSSMIDFFGHYADKQTNLQKLSDKTLAQIDAANKNSDFVIAFACWGLEEKQELTSTEKVFAKQLAEAGVDLIIGNRPNYLQEAEWITTESGHRTLCFYSLGNFVSTQDTGTEMLSGIAKIGIKVENGLTVIDENNTGLIPVITQYTYNEDGKIQVHGSVPFSQYTDEMAATHGIVTKYGASFNRDLIQQTLDARIPAELIYTK